MLLAGPGHSAWSEGKGAARLKGGARHEKRATPVSYPPTSAGATDTDLITAKTAIPGVMPNAKAERRVMRFFSGTISFVVDMISSIYVCPGFRGPV